VKAFASRIALIVVSIALVGCGSRDDSPGARESDAGSYDVETVVTGLEIPWELAFLPDGRALVTERPGRVRLLDADMRLQPEPVANLDVRLQIGEVSKAGEGGLLGLALDPDFEENRLVYLYYTTADSMKLERWRFTEDDTLTREAELLPGVKAGIRHDSGRIRFGPDKQLYISTGDAGEGELAQDPDSLNGKFLRLTPEQYRGDGPVDPEILSTGHRNPQGFDWEPGTERLISTEHGPSGNDGPQGWDEINEVVGGRNYGWPEVFGDDQEGFAEPLKVYEDALAPSGATFLRQPGSRWTGDYLFANLRGEELRRLRFEGDRIVEDEVLLDGNFGRLRTVVEGPDGRIYVLTSNRDGRGDASEDDDQIVRITPPR
jgi:glucose/arabinose dehydrogenase